MEETIKGIEVIAYKGMNSDMSCRDFKYEIGKTYKTDKAELCKWGFHACLSPIDVLEYYKQDEDSRYFKVKLSGEIAKCDFYNTQVAATEITILEEITDTFNEVIKTIEWWKNENVLDLLYWSDGFARVQRGDDKWNFIDKNGNYLSNDRFGWVGNFFNGFAVVRREDNLYNLIGTSGNYLSNEWCVRAYNFQDGFARVQRRIKQCNFIDKSGNYLSKEWFEKAFDFNEGFAEVQRTNGEWAKIDKNGIIVEIFKKTKTEMEEKIKQVEDIDTLKELNKNLISENERLAKKNMKLAENYKAASKKSSELKKALSEIKGFENAEKLCMELQRLKKQNKSLSEANAKLIADAKGYLKTIDEQKKVISASEKSIGTINDKLKIITLSQQSMHQALKDSGEEKSELVKKYKEALSAKCIAETKRDELEKEKKSIEAEKENIKDVYRKLLSDWFNLTNRVYKANLKTRIKYLFTKDI